MHHFIKRLPLLVQFLVIAGFLFTLALVQSLFNKSGIDQLLTPSAQKVSRPDNLVQTISMACIFSEELRPNQTFEALLAAKGLSLDLIHRLSEPLKKIVNLKQLKPGELFSLWSSPGSDFVLLEYEKSPTEIYQVSKDQDQVTAYSLPVYLTKKIASTSGVIQNSLWESLMEKVKSAELTVKLADIFAWEIDFLTETRPGDKLKLIYEEIYKEDQFVEYGEILAAEVEMSGKTYHAYLYQNPVGQKGYYDDLGNSLRKTFLKSPLSYRRISSGFSYSRKHPIFHSSRPHYGVDYAAPVGSPVLATADGLVRFTGWKGGLGRYVEIRHSNGWVTGYGHLSRIASSLRPGQRVRQQDVIGYVGTTGWTTGPHLHYQVEISGRYVNPLKMQAPSGSPVKPEFRADFQSSRDKLLADLNSIGFIFASRQN